MNRNANRLIAAICLAVLCALPASAQSDFTIFDFPGSTLNSFTTLEGINDHGMMVGTETTTGAARGFVLKPDRWRWNP